MTFKSILTAMPVAAFGLSFTSPAAQAFFPPIQVPGETVTVVPPITPDPVVVTAVPPVPPVCRPPHQPEKPTCHGGGDPGTPQSVPEPATLIATVTGLMALAGYKAKKK